MKKVMLYVMLCVMVLLLMACSNQAKELPIPDSAIFGYEGETEIVFREACSYYNENKEDNQIFLPIVEVLGSYKEEDVTKIVSCVMVTELVLEGENLTVKNPKYYPVVTDIKYRDEEYDLIKFNSAEDILEEAEASFPDVFALICGPLEQVKQDIESSTLALSELGEELTRQREYVEWANVDVSTVNNEYSFEEYFEIT